MYSFISSLLMSGSIVRRRVAQHSWVDSIKQPHALIPCKEGEVVVCCGRTICVCAHIRPNRERVRERELLTKESCILHQNRIIQQKLSYKEVGLNTNEAQWLYLITTKKRNRTKKRKFVCLLVRWSQIDLSIVKWTNIHILHLIHGSHVKKTLISHHHMSGA